jgi:hypothetical protein
MFSEISLLQRLGAGIETLEFKVTAAATAAGQYEFSR